MLPRSLRLDKATIRNLRTAGIQVKYPYFSARFVMSSNPAYAVVVSGKKLTAVRRNAIKRIFKNQICIAHNAVKPNIHVVFFPYTTREAYDTEKLQSMVRQLFTLACRQPVLK